MSLRVMTPNYFGYHCKTGIVHLTITVYKVSIFRLEELGWVLQHWVRTEKTYLSPSRTNRVSTTVFSVPVKMLLWRGRDLVSSRTRTPRNHAPCGHVFEKSSTLGRDPEDSKRRRGKNFTWNVAYASEKGPISVTVPRSEFLQFSVDLNGWVWPTEREKGWDCLNIAFISKTGNRQASWESDRQTPQWPEFTTDSKIRFASCSSHKRDQGQTGLWCSPPCGPGDQNIPHIFFSLFWYKTTLNFSGRTQNAPLSCLSLPQCWNYRHIQLCLASK